MPTAESAGWTAGAGLGSLSSIAVRYTVLMVMYAKISKKLLYLADWLKNSFKFMLSAYSATMMKLVGVKPGEEVPKTFFYCGCQGYRKISTNMTNILWHALNLVV
jgi:hypothetical protein